MFPIIYMCHFITKKMNFTKNIHKKVKRGKIQSAKYKMLLAIHELYNCNKVVSA